MSLCKRVTMKRKSIYLIIALVLPVAIFVFLKLTGKNQFDIPIYYESGIDSLSSVCGHDYSRPYTLPDSILNKVGWKEKGCSIFLLGKSNELELKRLTDVFSLEDFSCYFINNETKKSGIQLSLSDFRNWKNCFFVAKEKSNLVLMDKQKRIRGYYSIGSREEMDRLIVEMKILLKQY